MDELMHRLGANSLGSQLWKPGMRLLSSMHFRAKAILISLCFAVPLVLLMTLYFKGLWTNFQQLTLERQGLQLVRASVPLASQLLKLEAAHDRRFRPRGSETPVGNLEAEALALAFERLQGLELLGQDRLRTREAFKRLSDHVDARLASRKDIQPIRSRNPQSAEMWPLLEYQAHVMLTSHLGLDQDAESAALLAIIHELPDLMQATSDVGTLAGQLIGRDDIVLVKLLVDRLAHVDSGLERLEQAVDRASSTTPGLVDKLDPRATMEKLKHLVAVARSEALDGGAKVTTEDLYEQGDEALNALFSTMSHSLATVDRMLLSRQQASLQAVALPLVVTAISIFIAVYCFVSFYKVVKAGNQALIRHLQALSRGDLNDRPPEPAGKDETAQSLRALAETFASLKTLITHLNSNAATLDVATSEVAVATSDLAQRTEKAATSLERQRVSIERLEQMASGFASDTQFVSELARKNAVAAESGNAAFSRVASSMAEIRSNSRKIGDITAVIDGIAMQTNILALNAAVEAARAGEFGRGFAVVAKQVRSLATQSGHSASQIRELLHQSLAQVEAGTRVVGDAQGAIDEVVQHAQDIVSSFSGMADAASHQAQCLREISDAVGTLDEHTQQNAALVEQTSAAVASLGELATTLKGDVSAFRMA